MVAERGQVGPKAQEEEALPRIGRSARTARRARVGQSTFLGRPPKDTTGADSGKDRKLRALARITLPNRSLASWAAD
jgi:hypothetical protein